MEQYTATNTQPGPDIDQTSNIQQGPGIQQGPNIEPPAPPRQPRKREDRIGKLIGALDNARNADHLIGLMGLRPSQLRRVLQSRAFRSWLAMQRQLTKVFVARDAIQHIYSTTLKLFELREATSEGAALTACMVYLRNALQDPLARDTAPARPAHEAHALVEELLYAKPLPPYSPIPDANQAPRQITAAPTEESL